MTWLLLGGGIAALLGALLAFYFGGRLFLRGARDLDHPDTSLRVLRGGRGLIVAVGLGFLAAGLLSGRRWLLIFTAVFLGEELLETGVMLFALRRQRRLEAKAEGRP